MAAERLQKLLSRRGLASRRAAEEWIRLGRVRVNGAVVTELGAKADPEVDRVEVDGAPLPLESAQIVVLLHKPAGYVATVRDPHAERTVMELLEGLGRRVYPVGRLDRDSRGVLLFTDDGDLAHALLHPSHGVEKIYEVTVRGDLSAEALDRLASGVELEEGTTLPTRISDVQRVAGVTRFRIALREGRKRQVRRMIRAVGTRVADLARVSFAGLTVGGLAEGQWRILRDSEVKKLRSVASTAKPERTRGPSSPLKGRHRSEGGGPAEDQRPRTEGRGRRPEDKGRGSPWTKRKGSTRG